MMFNFDLQTLENPPELDAELAQCLEEVDGLGQCLRHPLVFCVPYIPRTNGVLNRQLQHKRDAAAKAMDDKNYSRYVWLHERPYRLHALLDVYPLLADPMQRGELLGEVWTDSEAPSVNIEAWRRLFRQADPMAFMDAEDRSVWESLPEEVTIYRGGHAKGISWTLDENTATWFANRLNRADEVHKRTVPKSELYAYTNTRSEKEIIWLDAS